MILAAAAALAAAPAPAAPPLGRDVTVRGRVYHPNVELYLEHPEAAEPGFYRRIEIGPNERLLQNGFYPAPAFAARRTGLVVLSIAVDAAGRITGCRVTVPSGAASLDAHACPHLRRTARFYPALDETGARRGGTVTARLNYLLTLERYAPAFMPAPTGLPSPPRPVTQLTSELAGIPVGTPLPDGISSVVGWLGVDAQGRVAACTLFLATWVDRLDRQICDGLRRAARFEPARDREGRAVAGTHLFGLGWVRPTS
jgi:TonB family protein